MTAATDETPGGRGGDGEGLCESATDASAGIPLGDTVPRKRPDPLAMQQNSRLRTLGQAIESSERPTPVVDQRLSRKSRVRRRHVS